MVYKPLIMMKQSLTYYITLLVIKLKGLKKKFSTDPIDYIGLRKDDVYQVKTAFFKKHLQKEIKLLDSTITEIGKRNKSSKLLLFIPGGAFVSGPAQHHWDAIKEIVQGTDYLVWMCNYPKAPESDILEITKNMNAIYNHALQQFPSNQISLLGDSVGGTLITALTQRLVKNQLDLPAKLILISPVMDASMTNPDIAGLDKKDPMLSKTGVLSAKKLCARTMDLKDPMISPLYGSFNEFPKTILFLAENDITYPDQKRAVEKLKASKCDTEVILGENMPHVWPLLPVMKEAKSALAKIITILKA